MSVTLEFYAAYFKLLTAARAGNGSMRVTCYDMFLALYTRIDVNNIALSCVSCYFVLGNVSCLPPARAISTIAKLSCSLACCIEAKMTEDIKARIY